MSYVKLFKKVQDHAVGIQSLNQAIDNNAALLAQFDAKHSVSFSSSSSVFRRPGRHDDPLVARTVARFSVDTSRAVPTLDPIVSGPVFGGLCFMRMQAGQWRIYIAAPQLFFAVALCESTAAIDRKPRVSTFEPPTGPPLSSRWERGRAAEQTPFSLAL